MTVTEDDPDHPATGAHTWQNGECTVCHALCTNHTGGTATCTAAAVCTVCGQSYGETDQSNHSGTATWTTTATTHEKKWSCCHVEVVASEDHEWENGKCTVCDYVCLHNGGTATCTAQAECTTCGEAYGELASHTLTHVAAKAATCTEKGNVAYWHCSVCEKNFDAATDGKEITNVETVENPNNHSGDLVWRQTATTHKQVYDCCETEKVAEAEHTWENGKCTVCDYMCLHTGGTATCTAQAECTTCGEAYGELASHTLTHVAAKAASTAETGNTEYWKCTVCSKYFSDEKAAKEITLEDTVIPKLPAITKGGDQTVTAGEKTALSFTSEAAFEEFIRVELDGKTVDKNNYTVQSGSTVVTLNADYVASLSGGEHTLGIVSKNGTATAKFTVTEKAAETTDKTDKPVSNDKAKTPKTGDSSNGVLWLVLLLVSGGAVTAATLVSKKKTYNR